MNTFTFHKSSASPACRMQRSGVFVRCVVPISALLLAASCGPQIQEMTKPGTSLVWPASPDRPRIQYVGALRSGRDIGAGNIADALVKPYGVAVDRKGRIFVTGKEKVMFFDKTNSAVGYLGDKPGKGKLTEPIGIAVSRDGRIFVSDGAARKVFVYTRKGAVAGVVGRAGEFDTPCGIALDERAGRIYVVDSKKHRVRVYTLKRYKYVRTIGSRGIGGKGTFNFPTNAAVDSRGNLYVVDTGNFRVKVFNKNGDYLRSIGRLGDVPGSFARPKGITVDSEGHIYVVDSAFQNVQIFDAKGTLLLSFGSGGWGPGYFTLPAGMGIDSQDRIYVVDQWPGTVQIFQYLGKEYKRRQAKAAKKRTRSVVR